MSVAPENAQDSSGYQGLVDWQVERSTGIQVGIEKATEGAGYVNPYFAQNWAAMKAAGLQRGAYHFGGGGNPKAEVGHFLATVGPLDPTDKLWLDIEAHAGPAWGFEFMAELEHQSGGDPSRCGVYTGRWYIDQTGGPGAWHQLTRWGYWFSAYQPNLPTAAQLSPWRTCVLWQNTSSARIPGVHGLCDASIIVDGGYFTAHRPPNAPVSPTRKRTMASTVWNNQLHLFTVTGGTLVHDWREMGGTTWSTADLTPAHVLDDTYQPSVLTVPTEPGPPPTPERLHVFVSVADGRRLGLWQDAGSDQWGQLGTTVPVP